MLSSNKINGSFDHQYLWKESLNCLYFVHRDSYQGKIPSKTDAVRSVWPGVPSYIQTRVAYQGWSYFLPQYNGTGVYTGVMYWRCRGTAISFGKYLLVIFTLHMFGRVLPRWTRIIVPSLCVMKAKKVRLNTGLKILKWWIHHTFYKWKVALASPSIPVL